MTDAFRTKSGNSEREITSCEFSKLAITDVVNSNNSSVNVIKHRNTHTLIECAAFTDLNAGERRLLGEEKERELVGAHNSLSHVEVEAKTFFKQALSLLRWLIRRQSTVVCQ